MKITEIRTRVVEWRGKTVPPQPHFCTNPMDILDLPADSIGSFRFHGWLIVEFFTDAGIVGIGNAALSPRVTKQLIDVYLKPLLLGKDPFDYEFLWQHMYRQTMAFGRKGVAMVAISALDIAIWDILGKAAKQPVFKLLGGHQTMKYNPVKFRMAREGNVIAFEDCGCEADAKTFRPCRKHYGNERRDLRLKLDITAFRNARGNIVAPYTLQGEAMVCQRWVRVNVWAPSI